MHISALARRVLHAVFTLSSSPAALTRPRLERRLTVSSCELNDALSELGRRGLLDAQRLRLTLPGLAVAVACSSAKPQKRAPKATLALLPAPIALFSQREAPRAVA